MSGGATGSGRTARIALVVGALAGIALTVIGIRFLAWPEAAARFFGVGPRPAGVELHGVVGLRDVWLGLMALAFAFLRDYRALALWLGLATLVCLGDAAIVAASTGKPSAIAFHLASGIITAAAGWGCWRVYRRRTK